MSLSNLLALIILYAYFTESNQSSCLFPSCKIGKTITEVTVRLSKEPKQAIKLRRLLVKLVTNKLSMTL